MKYSTIVMFLFSLLNIILIKCKDKYILDQLLCVDVYGASYGDERRVIKLVQYKREGELMQPNGVKSKFVAEVLYNDRCTNLDIEIDSSLKLHLTHLDIYICLIIPFYEGGDLYSYAEKNPHVFAQFTGRWIEQILMGLSTLHENNVLHNDIKEHNIFVTKDKDVVIGDLGGGEVGVDGKGKGTLFTSEYVSPERAKVIMKREFTFSEGLPKPHIGYETTPKVDIFSTGVIAYRLCTRQGIVPDELLDINGFAIPKGEPIYQIYILRYYTNFKTKNLDMPNELKCTFTNNKGETFNPKELIHAMLEDDPDKRPSAKDLLEKYFHVTKEKDVRLVSDGVSDASVYWPIAAAAVGGIAVGLILCMVLVYKRSKGRNPYQNEEYHHHHHHCGPSCPSMWSLCDWVHDVL
eukprot:GHVR01075564.1.p1 GENE.GHVR01075564.1~~GHVR01075564.1.p1  ORF type:complete len:406 (+),score=73.33 GHVR01075564.1:87-1304(+)